MRIRHFCVLVDYVDYLYSIYFVKYTILIPIFDSAFCFQPVTCARCRFSAGQDHPQFPAVINWSTTNL